MAKNIAMKDQTSKPKERQRKASWWLIFVGSPTLVFSLLIHIIIAVVASYLIVWKFYPKKKQDFVAPSQMVRPPDEHKIIPIKKEHTTASSSAPPIPKQILTDSHTPIILPDLPKVDIPLTTPGTGKMGISIEGLGEGEGTGIGTVGGDSKYGSLFSSGAPGLVGELYDLKQTPDGRPTDMATAPPETVGGGLTGGWIDFPQTKNHIRTLKTYVHSNWDQSILDRYYKAPDQLVAYQICIPSRPSEEATKAFGVADKVEARRWVIHYHGIITPPKTGRFRFVGFGDDILVVRVGETNVLDGDWPGEEVDPAANGKNDHIPGFWGELRCGKWIDFQEGEDISIDILIGEGPGGDSGFILLIEEEGDQSTPGDYPLFQVIPGPVPSEPTLATNFTGKTLVFPLKHQKSDN